MKRGSVVMLLEILIAAAIVAWLAQFMLKQYFRPAAADPQTHQLLESQGISHTDPRSTIDSAQSALDRVEDLGSQRVKEIEEALR